MKVHEREHLEDAEAQKQVGDKALRGPRQAALGHTPLRPYRGPAGRHTPWGQADMTRYRLQRLPFQVRAPLTVGITGENEPAPPYRLQQSFQLPPPPAPTSREGCARGLHSLTQFQHGVSELYPSIVKRTHRLHVGAGHGEDPEISLFSFVSFIYQVSS